MYGIYPPLGMILSWSEQARERLERRKRKREFHQTDEQNREQLEEHGSSEPLEQTELERKAS